MVNILLFNAICRTMMGRFSIEKVSNTELFDCLWFYSYHGASDRTSLINKLQKRSILRRTYVITPIVLEYVLIYFIYFIEETNDSCVQ